MAQADTATRTLCFLFTDIDGSTRLWETHPAAMPAALAHHDAILREAVDRSGGTVVKMTGDGMMAVFATASDGLVAGLRAQLDLGRTSWGETGALRVRMGLHVGEATAIDADYRGPAVNRAARIMAAGHGGQVLLSSITAALVADELPAGAELLDLGEHRLKDLGRAEQVSQLVHPGLERDFPPLATLDILAHRLPAEPSAFVGREAVLSQVEERLRSDAVRLLTLLGPGGIGKTRLALRVAHDLASIFANAAAFVDLSDVQDPEAVLTHIARAIGLADASASAQFDELAEHLRDRQLLLVLDNFEQVAAAAPTVARLLGACPGVKLLVTSREALSVRGEHIYPVPAMSLPDAAQGVRTAGQVAGYEAVQLFVERARAVRPDFALTDQNAAVVAEICLRLDGLPLAIELATARIGVLSLEAIRDRLGSRLALLRSGARDLPERQQTLRATIEWSYQLLAPGEQRVFELLASFEGARVDAVESVASRLDGPLAGVDTLDALVSLVGKSLLRQTHAAGEPRFEMLETIHEYASERLAERPDLAAATRDAHAAWYAAFAGDQVPRLDGPGREAALERLADEVENLRASWRYWVSEQDIDRLDVLIDALWPLFDARGWYRATIDLARDVLGVLAAVPATPERVAMAVTMRTSMARALLATEGYSEAVEAAYASALELVEGAELPRLFPVLRGLANFYIYRAEFTKSAEIGRQILRLADLDELSGMRVDGHLILGASLGFLGDLAGGLAELESAIAWSESHPYHAGRFRLGTDPRVASLSTSAFQLWLTGRPDQSLELSMRSVSLARSLEQPSSSAYALYHSGFLHLWRREPEIVRERAVAVVEVADEHDLMVWGAIGMCLLGAAATALGKHDEGLDLFGQGIDRYTGLRTPPVFWPLLMYMWAGAFLAAGRAADGLASIDEALGLTEGAEDSPLLAEFLIRKADLLSAASGGRCGPESRRLYERASSEAARLGTRMIELRAAIRLRYCEAAETGNGGGPRQRELATILGTFTEGFETPDLVTARSMVAGHSGPADPA